MKRLLCSVLCGMAVCGYVLAKSYEGQYQEPPASTALNANQLNGQTGDYYRNGANHTNLTYGGASITNVGSITTTNMQVISVLTVGTTNVMSTIVSLTAQEVAGNTASSNYTDSVGTSVSNGAVNYADVQDVAYSNGVVAQMAAADTVVSNGAVNYANILGAITGTAATNYADSVGSTVSNAVDAKAAQLYTGWTNNGNAGEYRLTMLGDPTESA